VAPIDLKGVPGLDEIKWDQEKGLTIGSLSTIGAIERSEIARTHLSPLTDAASSMASPQIRNRATFAGNICSAIPSADSAPALLALNAVVRLKSNRGERAITIDKFFVAPRETVLQNDELVVAIEVPRMPQNGRGVYLKLSPRRSMDLAIVGVAAVGAVENGICTHISIGLGAVAPTPVRAEKSEEILKGKHVSEALLEEAARTAVSQCGPIDDHRASAEYRCDMVFVMTKRAIRHALSLDA
jgi:carbon-monoxide dehydrogenase medium subunit